MRTWIHLYPTLGSWCVWGPRSVICHVVDRQHSGWYLKMGRAAEPSGTVLHRILWTGILVVVGHEMHNDGNKRTNLSAYTSSIWDGFGRKWCSFWESRYAHFSSATCLGLNPGCVSIKQRKKGKENQTKTKHFAGMIMRQFVVSTYSSTLVR